MNSTGNDTTLPSTSALPSLLGDPWDDGICNSTHTLVRLPWFWTALSFQLFLAPAAIVFNLLVFILLCRKSLLSYNIRLLLANFSLWAILASGYLLGKTLWTGYAALAAPCALEAPELECKAQELVLILAEVMILLTLWALAIERAIAACRLGPSEKSTQEGTCVGQCLAGLLWSVGVGAAVVVMMVFGAANPVLPYCNYLFTFDPLFTRVFCIAFLALQLLACAVFYCVLKVTEMLVPCVIVHGVIWTIILIAGLAQTETVYWSGLWVGAVVSEWVFHSLVVLHLALHPVFLLWCSEALRREARDCCAISRFCVPITTAAQSHEEQGGHFDILGSVWAKPDGKEEDIALQDLSGRVVEEDGEDRPEEILQLDPMVQFVDSETANVDPYEEMLRSEQERTELMTVTTTYTSSGLGESRVEVESAETTPRSIGGSRLSAMEMRSRFLDPPGHSSPPLPKEESGLPTIQETAPTYDHPPFADSHHYDHPPYDHR